MRQRALELLAAGSGPPWPSIAAAAALCLAGTVELAAGHHAAVGMILAVAAVALLVRR